MTATITSPSFILMAEYEGRLPLFHLDPYRLADARDARFIVVGTWGESPIRGAILGSTPHKLLHLSHRPVVVVPAS